jgi:hypothetical protein
VPQIRGHRRFDDEAPERDRVCERQGRGVARQAVQAEAGAKQAVMLGARRRREGRREIPPRETLGHRPRDLGHGQRPHLLVEAKLSATEVSPALVRFGQVLRPQHCVQVVRDGATALRDGIRIVPAERFLAAM